MQYLEQPILNCLLLLLTGLKSYFCFVSEGLGDWSKLFCAFKRWACFAFLHPLFPVVFHFCAISWGRADSSSYKPYVSFWPGHVPWSQDLFWETLSLCCIKVLLCQDMHCILAQKSDAKCWMEFFEAPVLLSTWCFSSAVIHTRATVSSPSWVASPVAPRV